MYADIGGVSRPRVESCTWNHIVDTSERVFSLKGNCHPIKDIRTHAVCLLILAKGDEAVVMLHREQPASNWGRQVLTPPIDDAQYQLDWSKWRSHVEHMLPTTSHQNHADAICQRTSTQSWAYHRPALALSSETLDIAGFDGGQCTSSDTLPQG